MLAGYALDALLGDPRRLHPVAGYGRFAGTLERRMYRPSRRAGAAYTAVAVGTPVLAAAAASALTRHRPVARAVLVAGATWAVLGGRTLRTEAGVMSKALRRGDVPAARRRLSHLCGRDPSALDAPELARATVESVAENTSDAVVAPLFWGAVAGLPGLVGYRAANTLDAMVGHRSPRYEQFGTASARLDDALNLVPSRLTGLAAVTWAPAVKGDRSRAWHVWRRDRADHPSPNAGQCEAAFAGALGVRLGGRNVYAGRTDVRPFLGDGPRPSPRHIKRAARLSGLVGHTAAVLPLVLPFAGLAVRALARTVTRRALAGTVINRALARSTARPPGPPRPPGPSSR
ncbi:cobalamin biosynthesis protein [Solwaraspora sp. WMMD406]|uniref:cobalamin biosynthesis protein n=1 Tax=Solwaraspora sp. WMMD406 TaxID=3016095 RepID=UPI0024163026|nr:cobalamin biosynthesis protein [Solwaraspora sp. WMMD406]MDG4764354.1 cobalamin biosynthesis protein [Solwaraspora sp. WMMD406]